MEKIIIGNLKMNLLSPLERGRYLDVFQKELRMGKLKETKIILCPSHLHLEAFAKIKSKKISLGAQNMFWEQKGSFTGEVSPAMLKNFGCEYVILGHSERRRYFCERDEEINHKIISALKNKLVPVLCVGETKLEREEGKALHAVSLQLKEALRGVSRVKAENIIIAYEPIWAVGSDLAPNAHEIMEAKVLIRKIITALFGNRSAEKVRILYGGSVSALTAKQVCLEPGMDGVLVGRESLAPHEFLKIAKIISN